jgi:ubiquinone/menaquinone biosynthesis C-methylase UbiE
VRNRAYAASAQWYDLVIEPLIRRLRVTGLEMFPPRKGMAVLDIGCGTGTHLGVYAQAGCRVYGVDLSPAMLSVAQNKVGEVTLGDASRMPFPDNSFDLVTAMLMFHEMDRALRSPVMNDARRVVKGSGRLLFIDYHPGSVSFPEGWLHKAVITLIENLASQEHSRNYRSFMANGGLEPLLAKNRLRTVKKRIVGGGTMSLHLLRPSEETGE